MKHTIRISTLILGLSLFAFSESKAEFDSESYTRKTIAGIEVLTKEPMNSNVKTLRIERSSPGRTIALLSAGDYALAVYPRQSNDNLTFAFNNKRLSMATLSPQAVNLLLEVGAEIQRGCKASIKIQIEPLQVLRIVRACD